VRGDPHAKVRFASVHRDVLSDVLTDVLSDLLSDRLHRALCTEARGS